MARHITLLGLLLLLPLLLCFGSALGQNVTKNTTCSPSQGPCFDREVFKKNLQYLTTAVLPEGWKLNAVVKVMRLAASVLQD